jgi:para-nitrobenzyl esterase
VSSEPAAGARRAWSLAVSSEPAAGARRAWSLAVSSEPEAVTDSGTVRGRRRDGVCEFLGIPYAGDPSGPHRFGAPPPAPSWTGIRSATGYGMCAPQTDPFASHQRNPWGLTDGRRVPGGEILSVFHGLRATESEDCLYLNVFTPGIRPSALRPVMVWLHGGGFDAGSSSAITFEGGGLVRRGDVVVVTLNHRLGALGYLAVDDSPASGNAATLDQIAALDWVRRNIAAFGGDPKRVMIFGQSGGGWKVSALLAVPAAQGLFHRAVIQSGPGVLMVTRDRAAELSDWMRLECGVGETADLRAVPLEQLLAAQHRIERKIKRTEPNAMDGFAPVVGGLLPDHPFRNGAPACSAHVPLIVGFTRTEMTLYFDEAMLGADDAVAHQALAGFVGTDLAMRILDAEAACDANAGPATRFARGLSDALMVPYVRRIVSGRLTQPAPTFLYRFDWGTPVNDGRLLSPHFLEVPFVFDNLSPATQLVGPVTSAARSLAARVSATWAAFAETGRADGHGLGPWEPVRDPNGPGLIIDDTPHVSETILPAHLPDLV